MYAVAMLLTFTAPFSATTPTTVADTFNGSSMIVLIQSGTGAGPGAGAGLETGKSGTGKETDAGRGTLGKESPFGSDQPRSGDFSPNPSSATTTQPNSTDVDKSAGSNFPSGIGQKGTDQTRSTAQRSGGPQPSASESMGKSAGEHGEGQTERAAKDLKSQSVTPSTSQSSQNVAKEGSGGGEQHPHHRSVSPSHLGPEGGSTADSGKAKHDEQARAEQEASKSSHPQ